MSKQSLSELKHLVVLPCSGPCNVGQLANQAAVDQTRAGHGMMFNLPGLAAHRPLFVQAAVEWLETWWLSMVARWAVPGASSNTLESRWQPTSSSRTSASRGMMIWICIKRTLARSKTL